MKFENKPLGNFEMSPENVCYIFYYWYKKKKIGSQKKKNIFYNVMTSIYTYTTFIFIFDQ